MKRPSVLDQESWAVGEAEWAEVKAYVEWLEYQIASPYTAPTTTSTGNTVTLQVPFSDATSSAIQDFHWSRIVTIQGDVFQMRDGKWVKVK